jgi:hypothetical protein
MRVSAVNRQYLGQNTSRNHPPESAAGRAANQAHPPRADRLDTRAFEAEGEKATIRRNPNDINKHISPACEKLEAGAAHFITEEMKLRPSRARKLSQVA